MAASRKSGRKRSKKARQSGLLTPEQQRDLLGVGLLALALFVAAALVPTGWLGERAAGWFPSGNVVGAVGLLLQGALIGALGIAAPLVAVLLAIGGLRAGEWLEGEWSLRAAALSVGLLLLAPVFVAILRPESIWAGWIGAVVGGGLRSAIGVVGGLLLVGASFVGLSVLTLRWNPLRTLGTGVARGSELAARGAKALGESYRDKREQLAEAAADEPLPEEHWTGPETGDDAAVEPEVAAPPPAAVDPEPVAAAPPPPPPAPTRPRPPTPADLPDPADPRDLEGGALPELTLLTAEEKADRAHMERELEALGGVLVEKLKTFNVDCSLGGRTTGPVVTQFEVVPAPGVKVNRIANLDADLALAMKAPSIRIVAPIPGKGAVGVEIPNPHPSIVQLRDILEAREYRNARGALPLGLGKDLTGRPYVADLAKMPHLLIAGATGSGKSVCINTIVTSLVYRHTPERLRLLMIDPKMVELSAYADLPHLRHAVITDPADAAAVLKWAVLEMERRYQLLAANGVRSLAEFNQRVEKGTILRRPEAEGAEGDPDRFIYDDGPLPYIVVVVDELADLMMQVQSEVERPLAQLAQKARAIGIHLIVATQRPSVNVITGLIKANFPTRIAFRVASKTDSRTILDQNGAESLLGNGDMLFLPPGQSEPVRIQGAYLSTDDTDRLISWYRDRSAEEGGEMSPAPIAAEVDILEELRNHEMDEASSVVDQIAGDWDELFRAAAEVCIQNQGGSTSLLQRRLSVGYGRAARIVDQLEDAGVIGAQDGSRPREVLMTLDELDRMLGPGG
ncbi:DNA translocase FtsK [Gaopeijia maritima]|uniref:DNA translocase FtsK n=1 Tax=Gaopeijia maritima TaxID=3119007 RepID=UPI00326B03A6